ncbi:MULTISPECIES: DUF1661 domain-containing protein [Porphyromonas]
MAREIFTSRTRTKKISRHVFQRTNQENYGA